MRLHWHRRDLRITDNHGLSCSTDDEIIPIFIVDPTILTHGSPPRIIFLLDCLDSLRAAYRSRGSDILIKHGDPETVLPAVIDQYSIGHVSWNFDYSPLARNRDTAIEDQLQNNGIQTTFLHDAVSQPPGSITTNAGEYYKVYSYYADKWRNNSHADPLPPPSETQLQSITGEPIPTLSDLAVDSPTATIPEAGTETANDLLEQFCTDAIYQYADDRDFPAKNATSGLSPHLRFGTIGIRKIIDRVTRALDAAPDEDARAGPDEFLDQLAWREFYTQILWNNPTVLTENFKEFPNTIDWRDDPDALAAWKAGRTGYPLVDAGMRQLANEAWMHNRVRMVVASFLTKDLLLDWRAGYAWFRKNLVDHDPANDSGGWQWAASTGTDAQPYFRIFNPTTQCERYDPDGEYVRTYIPELNDVPTEIIHDWPSLDQATRESHAPDYPAPIVNHQEQREKAIAMFEHARDQD